MECVQIHLSFVIKYLCVKDFNIIFLLDNYHFFHTLSYCMILFYFNFAINLNLTIFVIFERLTEFCILITNNHK